MALDKGFERLALRLQEAATALSHHDIRRRVGEALQSKHSGSGEYSYPVDLFGDDESGDVVYESHNGLKRAPYKLDTVNGKPTGCVECGCTEGKRDCAMAESVTPRTVYDTPADDSDHYTAMTEALKQGGIYTDLPVYERYISKDERDRADAGDFAGKGKSFPILKPEDVGAAVHAMGRAGSNNLGPSGLKARITAIAKRKGWTSSLPKSWQAGGDPKSTEAAIVDITGDFIPLKEGAVGQDGTAHLKLIKPGWGSSGYYSADVLERDGAKVFPKGTKNFWNHQTEAEESARPEGDLRDLASVLTEDAHYDKNGPAGPGLYAKAKVFEQFRQPVDDLAKHIGMSIRACGKAKEGTAEGRTGPIIQELSRGLSVDYVTTPGAGGQILQLFEAARTKPADTKLREGGAADMDAAELKKLQESVAAVQAENRKLRERNALSDAGIEARKYFATVQVSEAVQERVLGRVLVGNIPLTEAGDLDTAKLKTLVEAETKDELAYISKLSGGRIVTGMGAGAASPQLTEAQLAETKKADDAAALRTASWMGFESDQAKKIFVEGPESFNPAFNSRKLQEVTH